MKQKYEIIGKCPICNGDVTKRERDWTMDGGNFIAYCKNCKIQSSKMTMCGTNKHLMELFNKACEKRFEKQKEETKQRLNELRFLNELDVRISAIMSLLEYHEKYLVAMSGAKKDQIDMHFKNIEYTHKQIIDQMTKSEKTICEQFEKCMKGLEEKGGENE